MNMRSPGKRDIDEYLEIIWYMRENGRFDVETLARETGEAYDHDIVSDIEQRGFITVANNRIELTEAGLEYTRQLIRSHRIAERLVHDVLGVPYEEGACEFEHIINPDLVDSICTLLGHPRECPHGMPIPPGECCRQRVQTVERSVLPLSHMAVGERAKIAYVSARNDQQLHKLESLLLRPGSEVKLHQRSPSFVVECEQSTIALDEEVANAIHVWITTRQQVVPHGRRKQRRGFRHGMRGGSERGETEV